MIHFFMLLLPSPKGDSRRSSRMLYLSLLKIAEPREPAALVELLSLPRAALAVPGDKHGAKI